MGSAATVLVSTMKGEGEASRNITRFKEGGEVRGCSGDARCVPGRVQRPLHLTPAQSYDTDADSCDDRQNDPRWEPGQGMHV